MTTEQRPRSATDLPTGAAWDEALARVPGAVDGPRAITRLSGGANASWRVNTREGSFVIRLHADWTRTAGVDRLREARLHDLAARAGLAPGILAADTAGRFLVTAFVAGETWLETDMADPRWLTLLARRLGELHALPAPRVSPWSLETLLAEHAEQLAQGPGDGAAAGVEPLRPLLDHAQHILARAAAAGRRPCIVHNDLNHANLVGPGPVLLDWEYAAVADPLSDLACLLAYYPAAGAHLPLLLGESGLRGELAGAVRDLAWVYTLVSWLWYRRYTLAGRAEPQAWAAMQALRRRLG